MEKWCVQQHLPRGSFANNHDRFGSEVVTDSHLGSAGTSPALRFRWLAPSPGLSALLWNIWHKLLSHAQLLRQRVISFCAEICVNLEKVLLSIYNGGHVLLIGDRGGYLFCSDHFLSPRANLCPKVNQSHTGAVCTRGHQRSLPDCSEVNAVT